MRSSARLRLFDGAALLVLLCGLGANVARAAEQVTLGSVGQASANLWPSLIAIDKGFFAAADLNVNILYVQSSAALVQQVTAGSIGVSISTGLADPLRAVGMGAPISIVRIEVQAPPYDLVAKSSIASIRELKGKVFRSAAPKILPASMSNACWSRMASSRANSIWCLPERRRRAPRLCLLAQLMRLFCCP